MDDNNANNNNDDDDDDDDDATDQLHMLSYPLGHISKKKKKRPRKIFAKTPLLDFHENPWNFAKDVERFFVKLLCEIS